MFKFPIGSRWTGCGNTKRQQWVYIFNWSYKLKESFRNLSLGHGNSIREVQWFASRDFTVIIILNL